MTSKSPHTPMTSTVDYGELYAIAKIAAQQAAYDAAHCKHEWKLDDSGAYCTKCNATAQRQRGEPLS